MFDGLQSTFDQLVVGLEGDVSQRNFGWTAPGLKTRHEAVSEPFQGFKQPADTTWKREFWPSNCHLGLGQPQLAT